MARKRKPGAREPNGRLQRPQTPPVDETKQVLVQPHRKGNIDQRCGDAFGRYCLQHNLPMAIYDAGAKYLHMTIRWRTMMGVPVTIDARVDQHVAIPLTPEELGNMKDALRYQIDKLERKIINTVGRDILTNIKSMLFEESDPEHSEALLIGLDTLARQLGYFHIKNHPFK